MRKFAVILAGCGRKDGSEINEAITLLLSLEQHHCEYQCFAPNRSQTEVIDHLTDKKVTTLAYITNSFRVCEMFMMLS